MTDVHYRNADGINSTPVTAATPLPVTPGGAYASPNGSNIVTETSLGSLFSDDFGGSAVDVVNNWDVIDGGLAAIVSGTPCAQISAPGGSVHPTPAFSQGAIGSGLTGITDGVAASGLTVSMGTTLGAERWYLSKQVFAGKEDILVLLSRSQALAANSIFVGLVEVDPVTFIPLLNPNFAADGNGSSEFTNRGGIEVGLTTTVTAFQAEAIGDSSAAKAVGAVGVAGSALTTTQEYLVEIDSRDIIVSNSLVDSTASKTAGASRVSTQCPNDKKLYKLVMRFKNVSTPGGGTSVVIQRILLVDNYEQRVQISSAEGDQIGAKALAVNLAGASTSANTALFSIGGGAGTVGSNGLSDHKLIAAATTNATSVKATAGRICNGWVFNTSATTKFMKFYNKTSAPTVGTDVPVWTLPIPAGQGLPLAEILGIFCKSFSSGIAYALTGGAADNDTTALAAGDVIVNFGYV